MPKAKKSNGPMTGDAAARRAGATLIAGAWKAVTVITESSNSIARMSAISDTSGMGAENCFF